MLLGNIFNGSYICREGDFMSTQLTTRQSFRLWLSNELKIISFRCLKHFTQLVFSNEDNLFKYVYQLIDDGYKVR